MTDIFNFYFSVHLGEQYDFREYSNPQKHENEEGKKSEHQGHARDSKKYDGSKNNGPRKRCEGCYNDTNTQRGQKCVLETRSCIFDT